MEWSDCRPYVLAAFYPQEDIFYILLYERKKRKVCRTFLLLFSIAPFHINLHATSAAWVYWTDRFRCGLATAHHRPWQRAAPSDVSATLSESSLGCMHPHLLNMSSMRCVTTKPPNTLMNETKAAVAPSICK